ncbi:hypothetical protein SSX86_003120 [Deinandra increscens subsp. villosa]|uniref:DUF241 domain protein n=1 Tax=Deinandra increscens subsp. villosa TaxID=3103831 RepID=A0AAP0H7S8_9ASTR
MECSSSTPHFRSISLPSRLSTNHTCMEIETKIYELKAMGNLMSSSQAIQSGLVGLAELYVCVEELVQSPHTQRALSRHQSGRTVVEDALEGSIGLLESCSILKDLILMMKENVCTLQSALRRKGNDLKSGHQIATYLCFRKKAKKNINKGLGALKHLEKKMTLVSFVDVDHHVSMVSKVLVEVNALTISLFKSLLVFISANTEMTIRGQLLSRLTSKSKTRDGEDKALENEFAVVDMATRSLHKSACNNKMTDDDVQMTIRKLQVLDVSIDGFEAGLNFIYRRLIHSRSSLLNIVVC